MTQSSFHTFDRGVYARFVNSRASAKLIAALDAFEIDVENRVCADFGCNVGGFTHVLIERNAQRIYSIDTGYGQLDYALRKHDRVVAMERTNAMHASLPEPIELIVIDVAWTRQRNILPAARRVLTPRGVVIALIKPHYEAQPAQLIKGVLDPNQIDQVLASVRSDVAASGFAIAGEIKSPVIGTGGNVEFLFQLKFVDESSDS